MDAPQLREVLDFAVDAAQQAGELTLRHFRSDVGYELKSDDSPVTIADKQSEELLRDRIARAFPRHGIVGEEFGETKGSEPARWILDPIDGTYSFICRVPMYTVLVALEWEGELVAGVIHAPALGETVAAARGLGCTYNGAPTRVSSIETLERARLLHVGWKWCSEYGCSGALQRLSERVYADRGWCDAYAYLLLATGRAEIMLDPMLNLWDIGPLYPVITEAGGQITNWSGERDHHASNAIATNGLLHDEVLQLVRD